MFVIQYENKQLNAIFKKLKVTITEEVIDYGQSDETAGDEEIKEETPTLSN